MVGLILLLGWGLSPSLSTGRPSIQGMVWIPEWVWFLAMLPGAMILVVMSFRSASWQRVVCWFLVAVTPILIVGAGVWKREWHTVRPIGSGDVAKVMFLNAQDPPKAVAGGVLDAIQACEPDLVIVANPGWLAPIWRSLLHADGPEGGRSGWQDDWTIRWMNPVMVASPHGNVSVRTLSVRDGIRVMRVMLSKPVAEAVGMSNIMVVDLPSDPTRDRGDILGRLASILEQQREENVEPVDLLVGDFNTTPRTVGIESLEPGLVDLYSDAGSGWGATWPRERPLIRIDLALASDRIRPRRLSTFDPGWGGHRGLVIETETMP